LTNQEEFVAASAIPLRRIEGKYEILEKLREGGMGAIYKVRHRLLDEIRVIKLMRQQLLEDEDLKTRFLREARLAIKLRHPNIAQLYDFTLDDDGTAFIVMEFIDGTNLDDVIALHGPPPLAFSVEIAQQSLKALGYLHTRGFIHRDISPDNLMLTEDADGQPLVKLIDLGLAKTLDTVGSSHLTQTGTFLGKLRYAAPEQFKADGSVDARTDLYAFGVVLYVLLTGKFPIQGQDPSALVAGHLFRPPIDFAESDPAGRVPAGLRAAVLKLLAKLPEDRFATAHELSLVLGEFRNVAGLAAADLKRLLSRPFVPAESVSRLDPGSTQGRLNDSFGLVSTPRPVPLLPLPATAEDDPTVRMTRAKTAEARRIEEEKNRELAAVLAGIEAALARGDYRAAETLLYGAEASLGEQEAFRSLYEQIAEQRRRAVADKVAGHLESARQLAAAQDFRGALAEILKGQHLDPESREAAALQAEIEAGQKRLEELEERLVAGDLDGAETLLAKAVAAHGEAAMEDLRERLDDLRRAERRDQGLKAATAKIRDCLDQGDLEGAGALLDQAVVRFRAAEPLREQYERLEQLRRAAKTAAVSVAARLDKARQLAGEMQLDAAQAELAAAAELAPGDPGLLALKKEVAAVLRRQKTERHRAAELALAVAALEVHLDRAELGAAAKLLESAVAVHGNAAPLPKLRSRLEALQRRARSGLEQTAAAPPASPSDAGDFSAATQAIAELLSRREPQRALQELQSAGARFGDSAELRELRQRIASMLLND
jgi:serine/threonine protein kinase